LINPLFTGFHVSSEEIGDLLMVLWQKWRSASPVRRGAITREQYWVLRVLMENGKMKIKDLASAIGCTAGSASVAVKRLEKAGLVSRERSEKDERVVTVTLEKQGIKKLDAWRDEQLASMARVFEPLRPDERRTMRDLLGKALKAGGDPLGSSEQPRGKRG
jgi:DNA-binding MarR family transcriptional regulator